LLKSGIQDEKGTFSRFENRFDRFLREFENFCLLSFFKKALSSAQFLLEVSAQFSSAFSDKLQAHLSKILSQLSSLSLAQIFFT
jgi:hypothetical protein